MNPERVRIALVGFARTGKDTLGDVLQQRLGLERRAFGDLIKRQLDPLVQKELGFSAFTENNEQKRLIREVLVWWGIANYANIEREFFSDLPERTMNPRLFRLREAELWREAGGVIWEVVRPGVTPVEPEEGRELAKIQDAGFIDLGLFNNGTLEDWIRTANELVYAVGFGHVEVTPKQPSYNTPVVDATSRLY